MPQRPGNFGPLPVGLGHAPVNVDDLLKAVGTLEACKAATKGLLRTLGGLGYCVSVKMAQFGQTEETYLGYILKGGCQKQGKRPS